MIFLKIFCSGAIYSAKMALFRSKKIFSAPNFAKIGFFEKIGIFQCSGAIYSAKIAIFRSKKSFRIRILRKKRFFEKIGLFKVFLLIFLNQTLTFHQRWFIWHLHSQTNINFTKIYCYEKKKIY